MDPEIINSLAEYLNNQIGMETCDTSFQHSEEWLQDHGVEDVDEILGWLQDQGANCDCEVVTLVYLNLKEQGPNIVAQ